MTKRANTIPSSAPAKKRARPTLRALKWFFGEMRRNHPFHTLGAAETAVYCALARYVDEWGKCWPSIDTIVSMTGASRNTVIKALKMLSQHGYIEVKHRYIYEKCKRSNQYTLIGPKFKNAKTNRDVD